MQFPEFLLMNSFPDFREPGFDMIAYNKVFEIKNVIIHALSKNVSFAEHWGPLSVKYTIKGTEHYRCSNRFYTVDKNNYLILNTGQYYSSYIYSDTDAESFTINFSTEFLQNALQGFFIDFDEPLSRSDFEFIEKLYTPGVQLNTVLKKLYNVSVSRSPDTNILRELYYNLMESLLLEQTNLRKEVRKINAVKYSTQIELYKRLNYAKDFIHCCYMNDIDLHILASVACLNSAYFLREFKKYFGLTPHQCVMAERLTAARRLFQSTSCSIKDICFKVGYHDATSFSKLFKRTFHSSPENFRKTNKKSLFTS